MFEVTIPENLEEEVDTQRESFELKASFKNLDEVHVINDFELSFKRRFVIDTSNLIGRVLKQEPCKYCEVELAKGSELSGVSDPV